MQRVTRNFYAWALLVLACLAGLAFRVSFSGISHAARASGVIPSELAWIPPLLLDGGAVGMYFLILARIKRAEPGGRLWWVIYGLAACSVYANVAFWLNNPEASLADNVEAWFFAAAAPVVATVFGHIVANELGRSIKVSMLSPVDRARQLWDSRRTQGLPRPTPAELAAATGGSLGLRRCQQLAREWAGEAPVAGPRADESPAASSASA
jgi:hypothetical protein